MEKLHGLKTSNWNEEEEAFILAWDNISKEVHKTALDKGWWDDDRPIGTSIALVHTELSEALEAHRRGDPPDDKIQEYTGLEAEFADAVIRIMDIGKRFGLDISGAIIAKKKFNKTRSYRHGGKTC